MAALFAFEVAHQAVVVVEDLHVGFEGDQPLALATRQCLNAADGGMVVPGKAAGTFVSEVLESGLTRLALIVIHALCAFLDVAAAPAAREGTAARTLGACVLVAARLAVLDQGGAALALGLAERVGIGHRASAFLRARALPVDQLELRMALVARVRTRAPLAIG